jgi:hypothetical protein
VYGFKHSGFIFSLMYVLTGSSFSFSFLKYRIH